MNDVKAQNIAIIGSGISGLTAGYILSRQHQVTLFEANHYLGGHTHTFDVDLQGKNYPVNTGFIVFNDWTYPNFIQLMEQLGVTSEASNMSFSVRCENSGLEYNGNNLDTLFAQRRNLLRPRFWRMIRDILRFNKHSIQALQDNAVDDGETVGAFFQRHGYSEDFINLYIIPMGAAIWSASFDVMREFPLRFFLSFFKNHGLLSVDNRPQWRVLSGGSRAYIGPLSRPFGDNIHLNCPIVSVKRAADSVLLTTQKGDQHQFDQVIFACHSDQALHMLADPSAEENQILGAIPYQMNDVVLHTDSKLMPKRKKAWASWNYHLPQRTSNCAMLTYNMNMLQNFDDAPLPLLVTMNRNSEIDADKIIQCFQYSHPVFSLDGIAAQQRHHQISGQRRTHYCGAYWFNGFHEDGVNSALRVVKQFGLTL
ncbi:NAD(P)/FAD-dependent oxidoreductase [Neptunicella sp. SCSIO 80796]|uniref:NAD(P)/FAD-dependent oxidoreductase n=1 Tax=Neptunicella plasticusilytica TaxID=3117012 RepID=UPI003A4D44CA